jgi:hypothetical protein
VSISPSFEDVTVSTVATFGNTLAVVAITNNLCSTMMKGAHHLHVTSYSLVADAIAVANAIAPSSKSTTATTTLITS